MKTIFLLGDSIRIGYDLFVREAYAGQAQVLWPDDNCRFAAYTLRHLHDWKDWTGCPDDTALVHWNAGLWDCMTLFDDGEQTPLHFYEHYIDRVCRRIGLLFPHAKVIFATSTPMNEALQTNPERFRRPNSDVERYNEAAVKIVRRYGHTVNDLYNHMAQFPVSWHSDTAHYYSRRGAEAITGKVLQSIDSCLGITAGPVDYDAVFQGTESFEGGAWLERRAGILRASAPVSGI